MLGDGQECLRNKSGSNRLGFALLLKFFEVEARFLEDAGEIPVLGGVVCRSAALDGDPGCDFRECTEEDEAQL